MTHFRLSDKFINKFKGKQPKWGPLGYFTFKRTYSRPISDSKSEEFWQMLQRVVEGTYEIQRRHCSNLNIVWESRKAQKSAQEMFQRMWDFKFLPPGRGLWAMGTDVVLNKTSAPLFNCAFVSTKNIFDDFSEPFVWLMDMSMHGVGVGFDTEGAYTKEIFLKNPKITNDIHTVDDSREGWITAFKRVLDAYSGKDTIPSKFDYSQIRLAGMPIKTFGGIAPGPEPLEKLINLSSVYLSKYVAEDKPVDSTLIVDLMNLAGATVVAGGVRRTAEIALGKSEDKEFLKLKESANIQNPNLARWASNNTIISYTGMNYKEFAEQTSINGEPGYYWLDNARLYGRMKDGKNNRDYRVQGINPCGEIPLESKELCNIAETFPSLHSSLEDYLETLKYAFLYCKTVTLLPTHNAHTNQVQMRNRRIGISQSGIVDSINKIGFREHINWCKAGYESISKWDQTYSEWLCIPKSIKLTTVKPSGSVSLLPGVSPGIHFHHSKHYIRRVRVSSNSELWKQYKEAGYGIERDKYADSTMVIAFPVREGFFDRKKSDVSMWEQLELAAQMQAYWADNAVSITVTIKPEETKDLSRALSMYEKRLKSVSFLPIKDTVYEQPPYEEISEEKYENLISKLKKVKLGSLEQEDRVEEKFCDGEVCLI